MALTADQKTKVRLYLGYPDQFRYKNTRLESVFDSMSPEAEALIVSYLSTLATVETAILSGPASPLVVAGVKRVDEIWFFEGPGGSNPGFKDLRKAGRYFSGRISIVMGVPIYSNAFGTDGYLGDSFFGSNGGSAIPLG